MEEKNIKTIDIKDFKESDRDFDYIDDDFLIINNLEDSISSVSDTIRLGFFLIAICIEGHIQMDINGKTYRLQAGDLLLGLPNTIISQMMVSLKHKIRIAGFSVHFLQRILKMEKVTWDAAMHIHNNPVKSINEKEETEVFRLFRSLIMAKINDKPHCYHKEVMRHLFSAIFCEMVGNLNEKILPAEAPPQEGIRQSNHILRKFMALLSEDNGIHRSVAYYADVLCYSPKHFSKVIKQTSGKTPMELINENTMEHIKYRLKHSDKSIKEIAEEFDFPSQSFFGKYVKAHLGMSPANYRNIGEE